MEVFEPDGVVFLGVEKGERRPSFSGNIRDPKDFVVQMNWSFLNGVDFEETVYRDYEGIMDTYYVIGRDGRIDYISPVTGFEEGAINIPAIIEEIQLSLNAVLVEPTTWSSIKHRLR